MLPRLIFFPRHSPSSTVLEVSLLFVGSLVPWSLPTRRVAHTPAFPHRPSRQVQAKEAQQLATELDAAHPDADYTVVLERMGLQQGFDDLFAGTLTEMGSFAGAVSVPEGMEGTC